MAQVKLYFVVCWLVLALPFQSDASDQYAFRGKHFIASYCGCDEKALTDVERLEAVMLEAARASGATVLQSAKHVFPPSGLTMVILLSESHASIHTYPEFNACFIDLFTCGEKCSSQNFDQVLRGYLLPKEVNSHSLMRDQGIEELAH